MKILKISRSLVFFLYSTYSVAVLIQHDAQPQKHETFARHPVFETVGLVTIGEGDKERNCSGVLLDSRTVLTAAHCIELVEYFAATGQGKKPIGSFTLSHYADSNIRPQTNDVYDVIGLRMLGQRAVNEHYFSRLSKEDDIALVYLDRPVYRNYLPISRLAAEDYRGAIVHIAGYGHTGTGISRTGVPSSVKLAAQLQVSEMQKNDTTGKSLLYSRFWASQDIPLHGAPVAATVELHSSKSITLVKPPLLGKCKAGSIMMATGRRF